MKKNKKKLISFCLALAVCFLGCDADKLNRSASNINKTARDIAPEQAKGLFSDDLGKLSKRSGRSSGFRSSRGLAGSIQAFYRDAERAVQKWFSSLFRNRNFRLAPTNKRRRHSPRRR